MNAQLSGKIFDLLDVRAEAFVEVLEMLEPVREVIESKLKIEEAVMWAKKAISYITVEGV